MKAGDLIKCGDELATILSVKKQPDSDTFWLECLWGNGDVEGIESDDVEIQAAVEDYVFWREAMEGVK